MLDWQGYKQELIENILVLDIEDKYSIDNLQSKTIQDLELILYIFEWLK